MTNNSKIILGILLIAGIIYSAFVFDIPYREKVVDFVTCESAGYPVMESYPRQCADKKGITYREELATKPGPEDMIRVHAPIANAVVSSPVTVSGEARGNWYFEASFPVEIWGDDGKMLAQVPVSAKGEWMTTDFVPFEASISFKPGINTSGFVRFNRDNPSGLPENDAHIDVPVKFKTDNVSTAPAACVISGCSGQICSDKEMISTCMYRPEYACYKTAKCERQASGACGWTEDSTLRSCLLNPPLE